MFSGPLFDGRDPQLAGVFMRGSRQVRLDITALPLVMRREVGWWLATCAHVASFADRSLAEWMTAWARRFHADRGRMPSLGRRIRAEHALRGMMERLLRQYASEVDWWHHDIWSLRLDPLIPRREHEPRANTTIRWGDITPPWLREGTKFCLRLQMESGQLTWSTVMQHRVNTARFAAFVTKHGIDHPALAYGSERSLRAFALDFSAFLHNWQRETPGRAEVVGRLQPRTINKNSQTIDLFYRVMTDCRTEAAEALNDARWLALTDSHASMFRPDDRPRQREVREADERKLDLAHVHPRHPYGITLAPVPSRSRRRSSRSCCPIHRCSRRGHESRRRRRSSAGSCAPASSHSRTGTTSPCATVTVPAHRDLFGQARPLGADLHPERRSRDLDGGTAPGSRQRGAADRVGGQRRRLVSARDRVAALGLEWAAP